MKKLILLISIIFLWVTSSFVIESVILVSKNPSLPYGSMILIDKSGKMLTKKWSAGGYMIPYSGSLDISLVRDIITIEDARFFEHHGINIEAKIGSIFTNWKAGKILRGWSTLTEQYIKNVYYPWAPRTILQKLREWIWSIYIESRYTKQEILAKYLNSIYFGNTLYGIRSAISSYYPWQDMANLSVDDRIDIITRIHSPNINTSTISWALVYRNIIANRLGISPGESHLTEHNRTNYLDTFPLLTAKIEKSLNEYCSWKNTELEKFVFRPSKDICWKESKTLYLSVDARLMEYIEKTIDGIISPMAEKNVHHAAVYIYDPKNKKVLAYIGNRRKEVGGSMVDMIQERRSVWSILKPFIYLLALRNGADSESFVMDNSNYTYPTEYENKTFSPQNYIPKSYGPVRLREALGNSLNSATVRITEKIGLGKVYDFFRSIGLDMNHDAWYYGYGISIGTMELTLANVVESYTTLLKTTDKDIFLIKHILEDPNNRAKTFGISSILNTSIPLPVKTGTSTDFRDNWAVSYHPDAIIGVWVGNTNASSMKDVSGVSGAWPIWHHIVEYLIKNRTISSTVQENPPEWIQKKSICLNTSCFQKELRYSKSKKGQKSRPRDNIYYEDDFFTPLTEQEKYEWNIR